MKSTRAMAAALAVCACKAQSPEQALRARLGVPNDAQTVLVFGQTSHLDIDWQKTFPDYYVAWAGDILLHARQLLDADPRAFYFTTEMGYLAQHLSAHPEERTPLVKHLERGALRIVGGGMTSPDTLLPSTELLLRDFLHGAALAEDQLGSARIRAAYLPDSFGHSGTAPDVLAALGFSSVFLGRVDGAPTLYESLIDPQRGPAVGSTAALLRDLGSADFVWRGPGGAAVLAHASPKGLYCMGDELDYDEPLAVPGGHIGNYRGDDIGYLDAQVQGYLDALEPYARTPYLYVPVGCDFQYPKDKLLDYLDGWNARHPRSARAVVGTFEDYAALVATHASALPLLEADLTPYYMGFYGSRPEVKRRVRAAEAPFRSAELLAAALGEEGATRLAALSPQSQRLVLANHHDFVTGTATDAVANGEQLPLVDAARDAARAVEGDLIIALASQLPAPAQGAAARLIALNPAGEARDGLAEATVRLDDALAASGVHAQWPLELASVAPRGDGTSDVLVRVQLDAAPSFGWRAIDLFAGAVAPPPAVALELLDVDGGAATGDAISVVRLTSPRVAATFTRLANGFALTSLLLDGRQALAGPSFTLADYADDGGLWRMGHEMRGCRFTPLAAPAGPDSVEVLAATPLTARVAFHAGAVTLEARLDAGEGGLDLALTTAAAEATTRTARFALLPSTLLFTSQPGGYLQRLGDRIYSPTFWPAVSWVLAGEIALLLRQSTGARLTVGGVVELIAARDARSEKCDVEGGVGSDPDAHRFEWRIERAPSPAAAERAAQHFEHPFELWPDAAPVHAATLPAELSLASAAGEGALSAIKPADRGGGLVLRALLFEGPLEVALAPRLAALRALRTDAAERDLADLGVAGAHRTLSPAELGRIATLRLR